MTRACCSRGGLASVPRRPGSGAPESTHRHTLLSRGTPSGLRFSRDWGATWEPRNPAAADGLEAAGAVRVIVPLGPTVYLGGDGGLYRSEDYGRTWQRLGVLGSVQCILLSRYFDSDPTCSRTLIGPFEVGRRGAQRSVPPGCGARRSPP